MSVQRWCRSVESTVMPRPTSPPSLLDERNIGANTDGKNETHQNQPLLPLFITAALFLSSFDGLSAEHKRNAVVPQNIAAYICAHSASRMLRKHTVGQIAYRNRLTGAVRESLGAFKSDKTGAYNKHAAVFRDRPFQAQVNHPES